MMKRVIFILSGGLGNQLFQIARLHGSADKAQIYFPLPLDAARNFDADELCSKCPHISKVRVRRSVLIDARSKLQSYLSAHGVNLPKALRIKLINLEDNPYIFSNVETKSSLHSGYFQHWKYVYNVLPLIHEELDLHLAPLYSRIEEGLPSPNYGVIHFRRGDLVKYSDTMGLLTIEYFRDAIAQALKGIVGDIRLIVLTDDYEVARLNFPSPSAHIYGPTHFNSWESIAIMSKAKFVITSNSTFSWWGALMCHLNGGKAYIPNPWFKNWIHNPGDAFCFPGFNLVESDFERKDS